MRSSNLSPAAFHILLALAPGSKHGYSIMKDVASDTGGQVQLNAGTLYSTIRRLLEEDLIRETSAPAGEDSSDERRRYYALTREGRKAAQAEVARLQGIIDHAAARLCRS